MQFCIKHSPQESRYNLTVVQVQQPKKLRYILYWDLGEKLCTSTHVVVLALVTFRWAMKWDTHTLEIIEGKETRINIKYNPSGWGQS